LCRVVEKGGSNPFDVDVRKALEKLRQCLPEWKLLSELLLDVEALNYLSTVIKLQGEWVKYRASTLYIDPLIIELRIRLASSEELASAFVRSWHPIASLNQLTPDRMKAGLDYWNNLLTLEERFRKDIPPEDIQLGALSIGDLIEMRTFSETEFNERLQTLKKELEIFEKERNTSGRNEGVDYWNFIYRDSFYETMLRAYLASFLLSGGHASLQIDPLEDEIRIISTDIHQPLAKDGTPSSLALSISYEFWKNLSQAKRVE
jgi:hypothetical protein